MRGLREVVPFLTCILIYTNLHDTIGFVNPPRRPPLLAALDRQIFGVVPCVWAERFITPARTEVMSLFYVSFAWMAPSTALDPPRPAPPARVPRAPPWAILFCFYLGYALYVVFPAAPPRLVLVYEFTKTLQGYPHLFSTLSARAFELLPVDSRAAFPSLHSAVSLVALVVRVALRPLRGSGSCCPSAWACGRPPSTCATTTWWTCFAGWALAPLAMWIGPQADAWWARRQRALGLIPALGAPSE